MTTKRSPSPIYIIDAGSVASTASMIEGEGERPSSIAARYVSVLCPRAIGIIGSIYPKRKSHAVSGVVYNLSIKRLSLSRATRVAVKSVINESPNTAIPGASDSISKSGTGTLDCIALRSKRSTSGKPMPKARFRGSRNISFAHRFEKISILIARTS